MGATESSINISDNFQIEKVDKQMSILSKKGNNSQKYAMKTYRTSSSEQHLKRTNSIREYRNRMRDNVQVLKLLEVVEQKNQNFCSDDYTINLIFQYSDITMESEIKERRKSIRKGKRMGELNEIFYFGYEDLCNILYTCLSAQWAVKETSKESWRTQIKGYGTMFLKTKDIMVMENGAIKLLDSYLLDYQDRYVESKRACYSPEKMKNFNWIDDEKSAIFQLGIIMLKIALLEQELKYGENDCQRILKRNLSEVRKLYSSELDEILGVNVFDIIAKMLQVERDDRFDLQNSIRYAEQMYLEKENTPSRLSLGDKVHCSEKKKQLKRTNHSTSGKKCSPYLQKFYDFKDDRIDQMNRCQKDELSPKITNFVIEETENQNDEQSLMLESLKVQQPPKINSFSTSVGHAGIFKNVILNDSYSYELTPRTSEPLQEEGIFTDPELLRTIRRELQEIQERKQDKMRNSTVLERKNRFEQVLQNSESKINNSVYLD